MTENLTKRKQNVIAIVGATASGKTAYSRLVYKGFDIACAKPSIEERDGIPHHIMDIVEPEFDYSAGLYEIDAKKCIEDIISRGKTPIIVGGTGLYYRVLLEHYSLPKVEPDYAYREELKKEETAELYSRLTKLDSVCAEKIDSNDKKKIIRALEVIHITGKPMSEVQGQKEAEYKVEWIGRNFPREILYDRINKRVDIMFANGIIDETKELLRRHGRIPNILYTIGYQEVIAYLDGTLTLEEAKDRLKQNTRNYAKRQLTWFRKNENIKWNHYPEKLAK